MIVVYTIIITSIVNLSLTNGSSELWISLLSSAIGYVLPNPSLKGDKILEPCYIEEGLVTIHKMSIPFQPCSSMCISGQTGSGKTRFVYRLLTHLDDMYAKEPPKRIIYCYGVHQPLFDEIEQHISNLEFHQGIPSNETIQDFTSDRQHTLIILDDLMHKVIQDVVMELLFTQGCHHRRLSVIFITQNIFPRGSKSRTIALNTYYLVLMKNMRNASQITTLG